MADASEEHTTTPRVGLPAIGGGWTRTRFFLAASDGGAGDPNVDAPMVELWVPADPERLLDDAGVQARNLANDSMPYWAWLWESAPLMGRALHQRAIAGRVLEVGAGLGFVGLAAARQARADLDLTLSDHDPLSIAAMRANADLNGFESARVWNLDWNQLDATPRETFDVILGCDVIYEAQGHGALLSTCARFLEPGSGRVFLADPGRSRVPEFIARAERSGWTVAVEDAEGDPATPEVGEFRVLVLTRDRRGITDPLAT